MAGHNKWSQIKRKKAAEDHKRGKLFGKLIREVTVAATQAGGDPNGNPRLRAAIDTARAANMPKDNIEKAILRGTGELPGTSFEDATYEGYGPAGVAIYIEVLTDNTNRTVADLRRLLERNGGNLGRDGSVAWNFERRGQILIDAGRYDEDAAMEAALEAGADDFKREGDVFVVTTDPAEFHAVREGLTSRGIELMEANVAMIAKNSVAVEGRDAEKLISLLEVLEDHEDVQNVYSNLDIDDVLLAEFADASK